MYTKHGHQIPGTLAEETKPDRVIRCGGIALCPDCSREASLWAGGKTPPKEEYVQEADDQQIKKEND